MDLRQSMVILACFLTLGCQINNTPADVDCGRIIDRDERGACQFNRSVKTFNAASCKEIPDKKLEIECINEIAVRMGDEYPCYQHAKLSVKEDCERKVAVSKRKGS